MIVIKLFLFAISATSQLSKIKSTPAKIDEFDMLAQSRSVGDSKPTKELDVDLIPTTKDAKPTDFDEMEAWLEQKEVPLNDVTSSEFDKFLAERAAVAETLPSVSSSNTRNSDSHKKKADEPLLG